jgi:hypothetical protein
LHLRPVTHRYKKRYDDGSKPLQYGLIAEEVNEVYPDLVAFNKDGQPETVQYYRLDARLLKFEDLKSLAGQMTRWFDHPRSRRFPPPSVAAGESPPLSMAGNRG